MSGRKAERRNGAESQSKYPLMIGRWIRNEDLVRTQGGGEGGTRGPMVIGNSSYQGMHKKGNMEDNNSNR